MKTKPFHRSSRKKFLAVMALGATCAFGLSEAAAHVFLDCGVCSARKEEKKADPATLTFGTDLRLRYDYLDNMTWSAYREGHDDAVISRLRAGFDYFPVKNVHVQLWGQYADSWDNDGAWPAFRLEEDPDLYLANVEIKNIMDSPFTLKLGRQRLDYGDFRVIGLCDWANVGPYLWDAALLSTRFENGFIDIFYGQNYAKTANTDHSFTLNHSHDFEGAGFYSHYQLPKGMPYIAIEPFFIVKWDDTEKYSGRQDLKDYNVGARSYGRNLLNRFDYDITYVDESGDYGNLDIDAYHFFAVVGATIHELPWTPRVSLAYTVSSGDENPNDNKWQNYTTVFGVWGAEYGGEYNIFTFTNFEDRQINLEISPTEELKVELRFHDYTLQEENGPWRGQTVRGIGDDIGNALEVECRYLLTEHQDIGLLAGYFSPGDYAERAGAISDNATWFVLDWHLNFSWELIK